MKKSVGFLLIAWSFSAFNASGQPTDSAARAQASVWGICDQLEQRARKKVAFNVTSRADTATDVLVKQPCTGKPIRIKKCAIISVGTQKIQRYCFPTDGTPQHDEYFSNIEYWGAPVAK